MSEDALPKLLIGSAFEVLHQAAAHYNEGRYAAAAMICREVIAQYPENAEALHILGHVANQSGKVDTAVDYFTRAVAIDPANAKYNLGFADALQRAERIDQAIHAWAHYIALAPDDIAAHIRLAQLLVNSDRLTAAIDTYENAFALAPSNFEICYNLAVLLHRDGQLKAAIEKYEAVLRQHDDWANGHNGLAAALRQTRQFNDAVAHGRRAIALDPEFAEARNNTGLALLDCGDYEDAAEMLETARLLRPDDTEILNNLGVALSYLGRHDRAKEQFRLALELRPDSPEGHLNLANTLRQEGQLEQAVGEYRLAIDAKPDDFRIYGSLALTLLHLNHPEDAAVVYEKAAVLAPDDPEIHKGLGIAQLQAGNFVEGWQNYAWRLHCADHPQRAFDCKPWEGEDIAGGTLLVHAEQGFGDTLQFCRYLSSVGARANAGRVVFECQRPLVELMGSLEGPDSVIARGDTLPDADRQITLLNLPAVFDTTLATIPAPGSYLFAPENQRRAWYERLAGAKPRIGIVWEGNPLRRDDAKRSCPATALAPLLQHTGIKIYSLQKDIEKRDRALLQEYGITNLDSDIKDFSDTAAIISTLDLVISVDTATAHLAGALGKPVWVLLEYAADWRYLIGRDDSPWYPSMRLFRQHRRGDWAGSIIRLMDDLSKRFEL